MSLIDILKRDKSKIRLRNFSHPIGLRDFDFYLIKEITFEEDAPRREAFENVLGSLRIDGINVVYLILGNEKGTHFYLGIARNYEINELDIDIDDISDQILKSNIEGNFRGSKIERVGKKQREELKNTLTSFKYVASIEGVPDINEEAEHFQGLDRLIDVMCGDCFGLLIIANPLSLQEIEMIEKELYNIYDKIAPLVRKSIIKSQSTSLSQSNTTSNEDVKSESKSTTKNDTKGESKTEGTNRNETDVNTSSTGQNTTKSSSKSKNISITETKTEATNQNVTDANSSITGKNETSSLSKSKNKSVTESGATTDTRNISSSESKSTNKSHSESDVKGESSTKSATYSESTNKTHSISELKSTNKSNSTTTSNIEGESSSTTYSESTSKSHSTSIVTSDTKNSSSSFSTSTATTTSTSTNNSKSETNTSTETEQINTNMEFEKKEYEEWLKYIDEILLKRLNYARGKGGFLSGIYLFANTKGKILKLANSFSSLFGCVRENRVPLKYEIIKDNTFKQWIYNFQHPQIDNTTVDDSLRQKMILFSRKDNINWYSAKELSLIASFPRKEVMGLRLKEEVDFGLNVEMQEDGISLGKIINNGNEYDLEVKLPKKDLNKHIFVTGVTGSGKTTTCCKILYESGLPFFVIEPAKTEYRSLMNYDDILVFTLGKETIAPFRLNPFEFFQGENISSRVDMIKAAIESSFHMEAAIPQIIEAGIYAAYEKYGWDIGTSTNRRFDDPFARGVNSFPTFDDVIREIEKNVEKQGFDERLKKDYLGSIRARLQSLIIGSKGFMLNTPRSFDFTKLLHKKVVFELEEIKNSAEKSFVMALILINLNEALKIEYKKDRQFQHITLIEEAHRLLSRYEYGDSLNKKMGVETFTDMLAEVRKYGEGLIIVDQIPNKLTPEILKNTNTKIVHRIFASDDKEVIGNTMALSQEQKEFLAKLDVGRAIVFNQSFYNPVQIQIIPFQDFDNEDIDENQIRQKWLDFYKEEYCITDDNVEDVLKLFSLWREMIELNSDKENFDQEEFYELVSHLKNAKKYIKNAKEYIIYKFSHNSEFVDEIFAMIDQEEDINAIRRALSNVKLKSVKTHSLNFERGNCKNLKS